MPFSASGVRCLSGLRIGGEFRFGVVHGGAQYQVKHIHAPLGISRDTVIDAAVFILKSFIYRHDIGCVIDKQERGHETEDIELAAVLGFYLQAELDGLEGEALVGDVLDGSLPAGFLQFY